MYEGFEDKVVVVSYEDLNSENFDPPRRYFFRDALGNYVFLRSNTLKGSQKIVNDIYGWSKYSVGGYY